MRSKLLYILAVVLALSIAALMPWLAWREARRQAYEMEADLVLTYARDTVHRADETARQSFAAMGRMARAGLPPCSIEAIALMRDLTLTSTYIQAIGHARDGVMVCSSMGDEPMPLGRNSFRTKRGSIIYLDVPVGGRERSLLLAVQLGDYAVLTNRAQPLDAWVAGQGASIAVVHLDRPTGARPPITRGYIAPGWEARLGRLQQTTFVADRHLVAIVRSQKFPTAAIAAVPAGRIARRTHAIAWRLIPAGVVAGLLAAAGIMLLARRQQSVAAALRQALRRNEFFLVYQPIVDVQSGRILGAEALLRVQRGGGDTIGPDLFIPIAEEIGLISRLTERVFELVEQDAGDFLKSHPEFHIALNVSAADLRSDVILTFIARFLAKSGARPGNIIIEITERAFVDPAVARAAIDGLRARGVEVAIDDFGTGYSSLSHLESLKLDLLKIDRSFVETIGTGAPTSQVVEHIIAMARTIGLRTVAEGIETGEQAAFVRERGVEYAQGWLFGRPMPFPALIRLMDQQQADTRPDASR